MQKQPQGAVRSAETAAIRSSNLERPAERVRQAPSFAGQPNTDRRHTFRGIRSLRPLLVCWLAGSLAWLGLIAQHRVPVEQLLLDTAAVGGVQWYAGMVSSLGVLCWAIAVCACAATAFVSYHGGRTRAMRAFRSGGLLFGLLLLDDLFLLHSNVVPSLVPLTKQAIFGVEAMLAGAWIISSWTEIRRTRWLILVASLTALSCSVLVDVFAWGHASDRLVLIAEDGFKFFGTSALATWATVTAADVTRSIIRIRTSVTVR